MSQTSSYGYANEVSVYVIGGKNSESKLMNEVNEWLRQHGTVEVLDIKFGYGSYSIGWYSAMIIYRG